MNPVGSGASSGQALIETVLTLALLVGLMVALSQLFLLGMTRLVTFHVAGRFARALAIGGVRTSESGWRASWRSLNGQIVVERSYLQRVLAPHWFPAQWTGVSGTRGPGYVPGLVRGVSLESPHPLFRFRSYPGAPLDVQDLR